MRRVLGSLGVPFLYSVAAVLLGVLVPRLEARFLPGLTAPAGPGAAMALLSAIASGMLPLTGLVFSLVFVMVQFSSTAYSPRLVGWLAGSAIIRHSLGVFTGAFLYALAALPWIDRGGSGKVPLVTTWVAIAWLLASVVLFVMLIDRLVMLQISRVLTFVGDQGRAVIAADYRPLRPEARVEDQGALEALPPARQVLTHSGGPKVVQTVDVKRLVALASRHGAVVVAAVAVGDTVVDGMPLLRVHSEAVAEGKLRRCVRLGDERTFEQDPKYALRLLVDIAIRALSPAINDPTTAVQALNQVEDLLVRLGRSDLEAGRLRDTAGRLRVVLPAPSWEDLLALALDEIRYCGTSSIQVMRRMRALIRTVAEQVPAGRRAALEGYLARVDNGITRAFEDGEDRDDALDEDRQGLGLSRERRNG
ncbi:MAG TPA: DUF2254 domain-containing protein [Vicinamibacteria bacterium]|nr:DUF2254 domain-containing protein [Vicinamibacteria bacterium]